MNLSRGDTVLDLGCGTGLNFELLQAAVGPSGRVIGLDRSVQMLTVARQRITANGWSNVTIVHADATDFDAKDIGGQTVDAVIATYSLSVIRHWRTAWSNAVAVMKPGARVLVVDMQLPSGRARIMSPLARAMCAFGGSDIFAHPWSAVENSAVDVVSVTLKGNHIRAVAGSIP